MLSGVPQGSVLGPLLSLIYVNDLPDCISSANCFLFADNVKLVIISSMNDHVLLQRDLDSLGSWCDHWNLRLNKKNAFQSPTVSSTYSIGDYLIEQLSSHRDLGITTLLGPCIMIKSVRLPSGQFISFAETLLLHILYLLNISCIYLLCVLTLHIVCNFGDLTCSRISLVLKGCSEKLPNSSCLTTKPIISHVSLHLIYYLLCTGWSYRT